MLLASVFQNFNLIEMEAKSKGLCSEKDLIAYII